MNTVASAISVGGMSPFMVHLATCGKWHLPHTAAALHQRGSLAGLWISDNARVPLPREKVHRAWRFHLAMKPFYHLAPQLTTEKAILPSFPALAPLDRSPKMAQAEVVHAIIGYCQRTFRPCGTDGGVEGGR